MNNRLLELLLTAAPTVPTTDSVSAWAGQQQDLITAWPHPTDRAIASGFLADRVGWAFASAYQAALRALVPEIPKNGVAALCVTEEQGTAPSAMQSTLSRDDHGQLRLNGAKRWTTLGPDGGLFLVAARDARQTGDRPAIRLVQIPAGTAGLHIQLMPATPFVPEVPHAQLRFDNVAVNDSALLPGDGYARYVKPFRSVEDLHVHAAVLGYLLRESRRLAWPQDWTERALACLVGFRALADGDPTLASTHLALAGMMRTGEQLVSEAEKYWAMAADDAAAARWQRDRKLLTIAAQTRHARTAAAWKTMR